MPASTSSSSSFSSRTIKPYKRSQSRSSHGTPAPQRVYIVGGKYVYAAPDRRYDSSTRPSPAISTTSDEYKTRPGYRRDSRTFNSRSRYSIPESKVGSPCRYVSSSDAKDEPRRAFGREPHQGQEAAAGSLQEDGFTTTTIDMLSRYQATAAALDEWEQQSLEPSNEQSDIVPETDSSLLSQRRAPATIESPITDARYRPLCRAIKKCLGKSGFALAINVEEELYKENPNIFHTLDAACFRQYAYEAKRNGAPIVFTQNVDDQIKRMYFCLTRSMIDSAESANRPSAIGPDLEPRYLPLYRAMRESLNDEGYALGCDVEDKLLSTDIRLYVSLDVDSLLEYVQQAKKARAPIGFLLDLDYVEKLWFCPNDGMLFDPKPPQEPGPEQDQQPRERWSPAPSETVRGSVDSEFQREEATRVRSVSIQSGFCATEIGNSNDENPTTRPSSSPRLPQLFQVKEEKEVGSRVNEETVTIEERDDHRAEIKKEVVQEGRASKVADYVLTPLSGELQKIFEFASFLLEHRKNSIQPLSAALVADRMRLSIDRTSFMVERCNCICRSMKIQWVKGEEKSQSLIVMREMPGDEMSLHYLLSNYGATS